MAQSTSRLNLRKPEGSDTVDVETDIADNMDVIDQAVANAQDSLAAHIADTNGSHGYPAPAELALDGHVHEGVELDDHLHTGVYDAAGTTAAHAADTTAVHGIADTAALALVGHTHDDDHEHAGQYEPLGSSQTTVDEAIADLVASAPATLDTLNELAAALGDDPNAVATLTTAIGGKADTAHTHEEIAAHDHDADYEAAGSIATHSADTTAVHGIADTALLITAATHALIDHDDIPGAGQVPVQAAAPSSPDLHDLWVDSDEPAMTGGGGAAITQQDDAPEDPAEDDLWIDTDAVATDYATEAELTTHAADTTAVHGITDTSALALTANVVSKGLLDVKGDLIVATAADTPARLAAGTNGHVLTADSAEATGLKWAEAAGGGGGASVAYQTDAPSSPSTGDLWVDSDEAAQSGSTVRDFDQKTRTAGNVSTSSTSFVDIDTALDIVLTAAAGDWLEIGVNGLWSNQGVFGRMEAFTWVGGATVNGVSGASNGVPGWLGQASGFNTIGAPILYTVVAGDVSSGTVTLRFRYKVDSASSKTLHAEASAPFRTWAKNLGVPPA